MPAFNEIAGKRWGVIGLGDIGRNVAKVAQALNEDKE
jgi:phosphoglycerate dehydrogenase-like enzyme